MVGLMKRFSEPSTWAGLGGICAGFAQVAASGGRDATAWASVLGGVLAVMLREKGQA